MNWKSHVLIGIMIAMITYLLYNIHTEGINHSGITDVVFWISGIPIFAFGGFSGLLPDIDHKQSRITRVVVVFGVLIIAYISYASIGAPKDNLLVWFAELTVKIIVYSLAFIGLMTVIRPRHRGITHTFLFAAVYAIIIYMLIYPSAYSFIIAITGFVGYTSHLLADRCIKFI